MDWAPLALDLARIRPGRSGRISSWDHSGRNQDFWVIGPGEARVLADLEGPGWIRHIWMTQWCRRTLGASHIDPLEASETAPVFEVANALGLGWEVPDPDYYRKVLIRITWDDQPGPSVLVPLGDFFGVGHSMPNSYESALFTVSAKPEESLTFGGSASLNCWIPMPFQRRALIEVVNENDVPYGQFFHVDYELTASGLPDDLGSFHASWSRENPCDGWGPDLQVNTRSTNIANLDGRGNFVVLERAGQGHYVGCNLSVFHRQGSWWGEGDDMIFVDDDTWPPSLHGTGTEDYFNHAWGMQNRSAPYHGSILHEADVPGYSVNYRFHVPDPIRFERSIRVTIEHGHANHLADDWAATAYWFERLPSESVSIAPIDRRLPTRPEAPPTGGEFEQPIEGLERREEARQLEAEYRKRLEARFAQRIELSRGWSVENARHAADLRARFIGRARPPASEG